MAQNIYTTLETLQTETSVPEVKDKDGNIIRKSFGQVEHTLPRNNYPTPDIFDNEELFVEWARERNALLSLLQSGISAELINDRALFKRMPNKESGKEWSPEFGQDAVDSREWTTYSRPKDGNKKVSEAVLKKGIEMAKAMQTAGIDNDMMLASLNAAYKPTEVEAILEAIA